MENPLSVYKLITTCIHPLPKIKKSHQISLKRRWLFKTSPPSNRHPCPVSIWWCPATTSSRSEKPGSVPHHATKLSLSYNVALLLHFVAKAPRSLLLSFLIINKGYTTFVLIIGDERRVTPGVSQLIFFPQGRSLLGLSPAYPGESKAHSADS